MLAMFLALISPLHTTTLKITEANEGVSFWARGILTQGSVLFLFFCFVFLLVFSSLPLGARKQSYIQTIRSL